MKILLHSAVFWPSVGGIESVSHSLASAFVRLGHEVVVVTDTPSRTERSTNYSVVRSPSATLAYKLVKDHDIVFANGTVMQLFPLAKLLGKPFVWTHQTYRFHCPDGQLDTTLGPDASPAQQLQQAVRLRGVPAVLVGGLKLKIRRAVARFADANLAISNHMNSRQPLPNQRVLYNPVDVELFAADSLDAAVAGLSAAQFSFGFLGRMVSDKGVQHLLRAFAQLHRQEIDAGQTSLSTLKLVGDGPQRQEFQALADELGIAASVTWAGAVSGADLVKEIGEVRIFVIPSFWEEPMGIVAVELAAAGKPLIVSRRGGLAECVGGSCLTFENGNCNELCEAMVRLRDDRPLQIQLVSKAFEQLPTFGEEAVAARYLELFAQLTR